MVLHALNTTPNSMCILIWLMAVETYILADGIHSTQLQPNSRTFLPCTNLDWGELTQANVRRDVIWALSLFQQAHHFTLKSMEIAPDPDL